MRKLLLSKLGFSILRYVLVGVVLLAGAGCGLNSSLDTGIKQEPPKCGNGIIEEDEQCDSYNLGGATCNSLLGDSRGELQCDKACFFDTSMCHEYNPGGYGEYGALLE